MLLLTFAVLTSLGLVTWLTGHYFRFTGVAAIGAAFFIIAGSAVALTGLQYRSGEIETVDDVGGANETHYVTPTYEDVQILEAAGTGAASDLGMGGLVMVLGAVLFGQTLGRDL